MRKLTVRKKKNRQYDPSFSMGDVWNYVEPQQKVSSVDVSVSQGGDSWV